LHPAQYATLLTPYEIIALTIAGYGLYEIIALTIAGYGLVMRKLLHAIHGMLKHDKPFDNKRFYAIPSEAEIA